MKTTASLFFAAFALFTTVANAKPVHLETEVFVLPTYTFTAPRYHSFEKQMKADLAEARKRALTPLSVPVNLPLLNAREAAAKLALVAPVAKAGRGAKS